ncbi:MAG: prepilin-type N-terminal cleavage/methylation domain-containing protein [Burkholderiales bacterium]|nr:prepilin-type N-terminal cleavage/methylation domain-containing protein [Burkholderiales bacterium]
MTRTAGFTLLEMLVVLAVMGLLMGMVVPRLDRMQESYALRVDKKRILDQLESLPLAAFQHGQPIRIDSGPVKSVMLGKDHLLEPGERWRITARDAIRIGFTGACSGGRVALTDPDGSVTELTLVAPDCHVVEQP